MGFTDQQKEELKALIREEIKKSEWQIAEKDYTLKNVRVKMPVPDLSYLIKIGI